MDDRTLIPLSQLVSAASSRLPSKPWSKPRCPRIPEGSEMNSVRAVSSWKKPLVYRLSLPSLRRAILRVPAEARVRAGCGSRCSCAVLDFSSRQIKSLHILDLSSILRAESALLPCAGCRCSLNRESSYIRPMVYEFLLKRGWRWRGGNRRGMNFMTILVFNVRSKRRQ
jgi:hypothetical protein